MFTTLSTSARRRSIAFIFSLPLFSFIISQSNIVSKRTLANKPVVDCPCTIFIPGDTPVTRRTNDGTPIEVGMKFRSSQNGFITGIRYYKGSCATGTHLGHLWSSNRQQLGEVTFTNETDSGWQVATFNTAIPVTANTTYIASY